MLARKLGDRKRTEVMKYLPCEVCERVGSHAQQRRAEFCFFPEL